MKTIKLFFVPALIAVLNFIQAGNPRTDRPLNHRLAMLCLALLWAGGTHPFATKGWAATITVTSTADNGPGTLRDALASAANGDTIDATGVSGSILLTSGELLVSESVTILGPGPANLAVNGNAAGRVFHVGSGTVVTIASLTITNGKASGGFPMNSGGGIYNDGEFGSATLTVSNCSLSGNSAQEASSIGGGGIFNDGSFGSATLTVIASTLSSNSAGGFGGGGIHNYGAFGSATLTVSNCTLSGNSAGGIGGGGIYNDGEFSGNGTLTVIASTLSGNSAGGLGGGGIYNDATYSGNANLEIGSTILKAGAVGANIANASGTVSSDGYNLASDDGGGFLTGTADQVNTDPMLGPLQDNGGPTFTHALLPGSPAIDKGANFSGYLSDQRGLPRTFDDPTISNTTGGDGTDIGAFEVQQPRPVAVSLGNVRVVLNQFGFDIAGGSNQVVVVEASTDLVSWTALVTNTLRAGPLHFSDPDWTNFQQRFYRAKLAP